MAEAAALGTTVLSRLGDQFTAWLARRDEEPKEWRDASIVASGQVWLRAEELEEVGAAIDAAGRQVPRSRRPSDHPDDAPPRALLAIRVPRATAPEVGSAQ